MNDNEFLKLDNVTFAYEDDTESTENADNTVNDPDPAIENVSFDVKRGDFVCVIGKNGSGKSTVARLLNALLLPTEGTVFVDGIDTKKEEFVYDIRKNVGMVFQNPDNQIIGTTVEEDVAFGPENLGIEHGEMVKRVAEAMEAAGISEFAKSEPHLLSGGQKQRVAIAGILAMKPSCIVLDESTAMLDPKGRRDVLEICQKLNKNEKITIILITHHMDEIVNADEVVLVNSGKVIKEGTPLEIFSDAKLLESAGLELPPIAKVFDELKDEGNALSDKPVLTIDEAYALLDGKLSKNSAGERA